MTGAHNPVCPDKESRNRLAAVPLIAACCLCLLLFSGAKKSSKASASKSAKEIAALKATVSALEAQKVSLTAKVEMLEKDVRKLKESSKVYMIVSCAAGGAALVLAVIMIAGMAGGTGAGKNEGQRLDGAVGKEKHYEDLEYHVLNDWQNIWYHPENIDFKLYEDLKNHYAQLYDDMEAWKKCMKDRQELALSLGVELSKEHASVEAMPYLYLLAYDEPDLFIEDDEIKSGTYVCAHVRAGANASKAELNAYVESCVRKMSKKPYSDIRAQNDEIISLKNSIDLAVRKIKFTKDLPGNCGYIS